jgi:hypothetical protein
MTTAQVGKMMTRTAAVKIQKRPRRANSLAESRRVDVYLPASVWAKLNAQATRRKIGVARMAAEVLTQWAGKGGDL